MFKFFKDKLKDVVDKIGQKVDEEGEDIPESDDDLVEEKSAEEMKDISVEEKPKKKFSFFKKKDSEDEPVEKDSTQDKPKKKFSFFKKKDSDELKDEPKEEVKETPKEVPKEESKEVPKEVPKEESKEVPKEESKEVPKEESKEVPKEEVKEVPKEEPKEEPKEVPKEVKEVPKEEPKETPKEKVKEVPKEESKEVPKEEPKETPKEEIKEVPKEEVKETPKEEIKEVPKEEVKETPKEEIKEVPKEEVKEEPKEEPKEVKEEPKEEKKGFFSKLSNAISQKKLTEDKFDDIFFDLEIVLLENNVAFEVVEKIKNDLKKELVETSIPRNKITQIIINALTNSIDDLFNVEIPDLLELVKSSEKPFKILMIGVNGSGKTTTLAKLVKFFQNNNVSCVIGAADTFRAAAIQQLEEHANNLNVKMIKHDYGSDAAAVAFDTVKYAQSHNIDVVLVDSAGRLHSNVNLMNELKKVIKIMNPDFRIFVGESITGNDCVEQAVQFNDSVGIDGIILTKTDVDDKGGAAISVSYVTQKPILFLGEGQNYDDLIPFNSQTIKDSIGLNEE